ncbi:MAG: 3-oxoacyl-ACP synthase III [Planctomycetota bacterium]|nr:3-oxoacyl-ACP synthase III [Planctomycetota bacterium]MDA1179894.1 3-oxoacyl-ACP synthase III [Planctomycetota bacterium]
MQFQRVCLESMGYVLPREIVSSSEIEQRLQPLYERLRLPEGRLELMTGIRERRVWRPGTLPSDPSIQSARLALQAAGLPVGSVGALLHGSVCRDHLEPATACRVHYHVGLPAQCQIFDVSNACLGLLNGMLQVANMIELGWISAGLVVGTESSRPLLDKTIESLNADPSLTRQQIKSAVASLTIGSASCAMLLVDEKLSRTGNRFTAAAVRAHTQHHELCQSGADEAVASGMQPLMDTDSETLLREGVATGQCTFQDFLAASQWELETLAATFTHQVTVPHRRLMYESLGLDVQRDFSTVEWLGNTGSAALPTTLAIGCQSNRFDQPARVALLGIGSGINCVMAAVEWHHSRILSGEES